MTTFGKAARVAHMIVTLDKNEAAAKERAVKRVEAGYNERRKKLEARKGTPLYQLAAVMVETSRTQGVDLDEAEDDNESAAELDGEDLGSEDD